MIRRLLFSPPQGIMWGSKKVAYTPKRYFLSELRDKVTTSVDASQEKKQRT